MHLFAIGDLHLSFGLNKRMDIFEGWQDYESKIEKTWKNLVSADDTVVLVGDTSWGLGLQETKLDFEFINNLPGQKLILKGNHDFWWSSGKKIQEFWQLNGFNTLKLLHNNAYLFGKFGLCGSRGWQLNDPCETSNQKIMAREALRIESSILSALKLGAQELFVFLHYPPVLIKQKAEPILEVFNKYQKHIKSCFYAHLHGISINSAFNGNLNSINFQLVSADSLAFKPFKIL